MVVGVGQRAAGDGGSFLRWAGAKRAHLDAILQDVPSTYGRYFEPFLGSGALFYRLAPTSAVLGDLIHPLIDTYKAVRDGPAAIHRELEGWPVDKDSYYAVRSLSPTSRFTRAAQFIYLNKTGWNGLYRVNSSGQYNVPYGRPKSDNIVSLERLRLCSAALRGNVSLLSTDFEETVSSCGKGDLVFFDPPYVTGHKNNGFVDYNEKLFSWHDQQRLATLAEALASKGAHVVVTNADHDSIRDLYDGFQIRQFARHSTLAGSSEHRRQVTELVISTRGGAV